MKTTLIKLTAGVMLGFLAVSPLPAQNTASVEADTNHTSGYSEEFEKQKLEVEREMQKDRLDSEKAIADLRSSSHRMMVHDIAVNSWIILLFGLLVFGYLKDKRRHETIRFMVEKGAPLTPELLAGLRRNRGRLTIRTTYDPHGYLCWGLTLVAVAVGLFMLYVKAAWIVLAVGVANLLLWCIDRLFGNSGESK